MVREARFSGESNPNGRNEVIMPKTNKFAFMQYEESNPLGKVVDFLTTNHFSAVISPLHDSDVWTAEEVKQWRDSQWKLYKITIPEDATEYARPTGELRRDGCCLFHS